MKNILKYTTAAAALILSLASCEELEDYQTTIDAAPKLAYLHTQSGDTFSTLITHRPTGSTGSFKTEFQVSCNTTSHPEAIVTVEHDNSLVDTYNESHGTSYAALPKEYLTIENAKVRIPENANASADTVRLSLSETADLALLTERTYLAPLKLSSSDMQTSEQMGNLYFVVNTETNLIRPITSENEITGFSAGNTAGWTADCGDYKNLFDSNNGTGVNFSNEKQNVLTIDMKAPIMVTGLKIETYSISGISIEYSEDGIEWKQAGTPVEGEFVFSGSDWGSGIWAAAVYDWFTARYLRLTFKMTGSWYTSINDISVNMIESSEPTIYTITGTDNVVTGKVVHKKGMESAAQFEASFKAFTTISSENGWNVTAAVDNSLIADYNSKHGTSHKALPSENLSISTASLSIAAGENSSSEEITLSLTGDVSGLTDENGYIAPLKLSADGAVSSKSRGVVYVVINSETNLIKPISSPDEIVGFPAGGKSSWTADIEGASALFDGNNESSIELQSEGNVLTVNMGSKHLVTGLDICTYSIANPTIEYSLDGSSWKSAGTVSDGDAVCTWGSWSAGDMYIAFTEHLEAQYIRVKFAYSGWYTYMCEFSVYEIESTEPTIYTVCGGENVLTGKIVHHNIAGSIASLSASFNAMTTVASESGYSVNAVIDNSLVDTYNRNNGTKYATMDASYVELSGVPCSIAAGANRSDDVISVSLKGDLSKLTNTNGYVIPVKFEAPSGAVVSTGRGVVYIVLTVENSDAAMMANFDINAIAGTLVADRSAWKIVSCDEGGIYPDEAGSSYDYLFDSNTETFIRTWGGPVTFTADLGQEYEMTGLVITARTDNEWYASYQPNSVQVMISVDGESYTNLGTAAKDDGTIVASVPSSYVSFYGSRTVRYVKIEAGYGSNMGTSEFNIYAK